MKTRATKKINENQTKKPANQAGRKDKNKAHKISTKKAWRKDETGKKNGGKITEENTSDNDL